MKIEISLREAEILRLHLEDFLEEPQDAPGQITAALRKVLKQVNKALDYKPPEG